jgi:hypothetical protein
MHWLLRVNSYLCWLLGHNWVDMTNEVITGGRFCLRCGKLDTGASDEH